MGTTCKLLGTAVKRCALLSTETKTIGVIYTTFVNNV